MRRHSAPLTAREVRLLLLCGGLYAIIVVVLRLKHGGDIVPEIALSERLLTGERLYGIGPAHGTHWPPFAALAVVPLVPIARVSLPLALAVWSVVGVACLVGTVAVARRWGWRPVLLALAATAMPIQTNFEHRNLNTILLLLVVAAAADLEDQRDARAGTWLGLATALKAFPALILVYLAVRGRWRALAVAVGVAAAATLVPLAAHGIDAGVTATRDWLALTLNPSRWPPTPNDQSLRALALRLGWPAVSAAVLAILCVAAIPLVSRREPAGRYLSGTAAATLAAALMVPVSWVHYFVLAFPAWVALLAGSGTRGEPAIRRAAMWLAAVATSGWLTMGQGPWRRALLDANLYTWGGLLLLLLLVTQPDQRHPEAR